VTHHTTQAPEEAVRMEMPYDVMTVRKDPRAMRSYRSTILAQSADEVWAMIRDFNGYPAYIDGVTESILEDDKAGDEVGAVRCFIYNGDQLRQTLTGHSDADRWFTHAGCEPLQWPLEGDVGPVTYENAIHVMPLSDGNRAFVEWWLDYYAEDPGDTARWKQYFDESLPEWFGSLQRHLDAAHPPVAAGSPVLITGLKLKDGVTPEQYERFAAEVDKPTCERELRSIRAWHVHRVQVEPGAEQPPFDYVEVVQLTDLGQFAEDLKSPVVERLGAGLAPLVEEPTMYTTKLVV
jgi:REDY-like protein HapK/Polyketide cyclase / dehydrase and lipid transport